MWEVLTRLILALQSAFADIIANLYFSSLKLIVESDPDVFNY